MICESQKGVRKKVSHLFFLKLMRHERNMNLQLRGLQGQVIPSVRVTFHFREVKGIFKQEFKYREDFFRLQSENFKKFAMKEGENFQARGCVQNYNRMCML